MGNCLYVNQAKSGPSKGWYCNQEGMYVDSSYWKNYCSGSTSYRHCPYLDGDDSFRNSGSSGGSSDGGQTKKEDGYSGSGYSSQPEYGRTSVESGYDSGYSGGYAGGGYTGGSSGGCSGSGGGLIGGIFGFFEGILDAGFKLLIGGGAVLFVIVLIVFLCWNGIRFLGAQIGLVKSPLTINLSLPEDSSIQAEDISFQLIGESGTGKAVEAALDEDGTCSIHVKKDTYEFVQKYDGLSICLGVGTVDGTSEYDLAADTHLMENWIVRFSFCDTEGNEIFPEEVSVTDSSGSQLELVKLEENRYVCPMVNLEETGTLSVRAEGYEEVQVEPETGSRIMNCTVVLRQER